MLTLAMTKIRAATPEEDVLIAEHFYQMWLDNDISPDAIVENWQETILEYIEMARRELGYQAFVATVADQIIGSAGCQKFAGLYPNIMRSSYRQDGYIWGVYVESAYRRQGIGAKLTAATLEHLRTLGCTQAVLNASPFGKPVYEQLGFIESNVMRMPLISQD